ncbi:MAG: hypothetical protein JEY99_11025 [Spirochaetales bacterium]|nr:hypothetical protein [Spirochaetales bacterium]
MARNKIYTYLIDSLNMGNAESLKLAIKSVPSVEEVFIKVKSGVIEVTSKKDVEQEIAMACTVAGCALRTRVSMRKASYFS